MDSRRRNLLIFLSIVVLLAAITSKSSAEEENGLDLSGRWVSLQYGSLTFSQDGNSFTAVWTGTNAAGTISGNQASFRFWSGTSFAKCKDDSRGYGTLTLSDDGNTLSGSWANLSKKEPESGSFTAMRVSSISGQITQDAAPALEEPPDGQSMVTEPAPPGTAPTAGASSETSPAEPPNGLILIGENVPSGYVGPIAEALSDLEESVLKIFSIFDDDAGDMTDGVPQQPAETIMPEDSPLQDSDDFWGFFADLWTSIWGP